MLKRHRRAAGLTQEGLAERAGLSVRGISDLERGASRSHRPDTVQRLAAALRLSAQERVAVAAAAQHSGAFSSVQPAGASLSPPSSAFPPFVGRRRELALLERHLAGDGPPVLLLAGEPGIGKSRLLREATDRAVGRRWRVLAGGCQRPSGQEPYAPLLGALQGYIADLQRLTANL